MTTWIIVTNVFTFIADVISRGRLSDWGALSPESLLRGQIWRILTFQFLHASPGHLFFNVLWFYFVGKIVEGRLAKARFLAFYLISGLGGGAGFLLLWKLQVSEYSAASRLVGASAGILGVMAATAMLWPHYTVRLLFPPVSLTLRLLFWITVGLALLTIYSGGWNAGGEAAHLGGAAVGAILIRNTHWLTRVTRRAKTQRFWRPGDPASNFFRRDAS